MNEITRKLAKEVLRVLLSAFLAALGIESVGCVACGNGASASCITCAEPAAK